MLDILIDRFNYIPIIVLMMTGLYVIFATGNLVKRLVGLSLFQTSVFLLYITIGKVFNGSPPIIADGDHGDGHGDSTVLPAVAESEGHYASDTAQDLVVEGGAILYSNPLPHVLILTAIVVGVATLAVGLALVVRIREAYGTIEDDALNAADYSLETGSVD